MLTARSPSYIDSKPSSTPEDAIADPSCFVVCCREQDYWRLKDALLLLGETPVVPSSPRRSPSPCRAHSPSLTCSPMSPRRPQSPMRTALEAVVDDARREVAAAAVHVVEAIEEEVIQKKIR